MVFEPVIEQMVKYGVYDFVLPFLITTAILYGLLRKSQVLGASALLNGTVALCVGLMIFAFPYFARQIAFATVFSTFFTQFTIFTMVFVMALLVASLFYPNLQEWLASMFVRRTTLWVMMGLGIVFLTTSGLIQVLAAALGRPPPPGMPALPLDVIVLITGIVLFIVLIMIAASMVARAE